MSKNCRNFLYYRHYIENVHIQHVDAQPKNVNIHVILSHIHFEFVNVINLHLFT